MKYTKEREESQPHSLGRLTDLQPTSIHLKIFYNIFMFLQFGNIASKHVLEMNRVVLVAAFGLVLHSFALLKLQIS